MYVPYYLKYSYRYEPISLNRTQRSKSYSVESNFYRYIFELMLIVSFVIMEVLF